VNRLSVARVSRGTVTVAILLVTVVVLPARAAFAATMTVRACDSASFDDELDLQRAMNLADNETDRPGHDTIVLQSGCVYTFTEPVGETGPIDALPAVDTRITIRGNGAAIQMQDGTEHLVDHLIRVTRTGNLRLENVTLRNNFADWRFGGGALYNIGITTLDRVTVTDIGSGAVFNHWDGTMTVLDSTFSDNRRGANSGAGIENEGILFVDDSIFTGNRTTRSLEGNHHNGGAIWIGDSGAALITDSVFDRNSSIDLGGAVFSFGTVSISRSTFTNNTGGAVTDWTGRLIVSNSYFASNTSNYKGGAIHAGHDGTITNSTFYQNVAIGEGGGVYGAIGSNLSITNATFAENSSRSDVGDAISHHGDSGTTKNSIFAGHDHACDQVPHGGENLVDEFDPTCSGGFRLGDPKLQPPALNGGGTPTMKLGPGSAALDKAVSTSCLSTDQRGQPRPAGPHCDIGAFEDQVPTTPGTPILSAGGPSPSKTGAFTIAWGASNDPDGPVSYKLFHRDADDSTASPFVTTTAMSAAFIEREGTFSYHVAATDGNHDVASSSLNGIVVDKTAPGAPNLTADRTPDYAPGTGPSNDWYRTPVTITISDSGDPMLADGSPGSGIASVTPSPTFDTSGPHTATGIATDAAGNSSSPAQLTVNVDAENPSIGFTSCPATALLGHPAEATWTASDPSSGLATPSGGTIPLDTSTIGRFSVVADAVDNVGHAASAPCEFDVIFDFDGFFTPVANPPELNDFAAGRVVTAVFSLAGDQGPAVIAAGYPQSIEVSCDSFGEQIAGSPTTATPQGLTFSAGRYRYPWKTSSDWRDTCRQLIVKLIDGTYHRANFDFR